MYDKIKGEKLMERVGRVEAARGKRQYGSAGGRKLNDGAQKIEQGSGCTPFWFTNFQILLGTHLTVDGAEE